MVHLPIARQSRSRLGKRPRDEQPATYIMIAMYQQNEPKPISPVAKISLLSGALQGNASQVFSAC